MSINTYTSGVHIRDVEPVGPVNQVSRLSAILEDVLVGNLVELLNLVALESQTFKCPVLVLNVISLRSDGSDNAKVVASSLQSPPELGIGINCGESSVGEHNVHRLKLVSNESVATLEPAMASTEGGSDIADTLTAASDYYDGISILANLSAFLRLPVCLLASQSVWVTSLDLVPPRIVTLFPSLAISTPESWLR